MDSRQESSETQSQNTFFPLSIQVFSTLTLIIYSLELVLNRTLYRVLVFMPPQVSSRMSLIVSTWGSVFLAASTLFPIATVTIANYTLGGLLTLAWILDYIGVFKIGALLGALAIYIVYRLEAKRILEAILLAVMSINIFISHPMLVYAANILWLLTPLPYMSKSNLGNLKYSLPIALLALYAVYHAPYITGQVLIFAMNLVSPWLLPPALILYSLAPSPGRIALLLTGPLLQLSNQVLVIISSYLTEGWEKR